MLGIKKGTCTSKSVAPNLSVCTSESSVPYADVSFRFGLGWPPISSRLSSRASRQAEAVQNIQNRPIGYDVGSHGFARRYDTSIGSLL
jgi:hypothetical protein